ncbi:hypothetical protein D9619_004696 [Psilocybe cf. subviscida]|uniref:ABC transporter n=1 Tax=Psilocybe cf. subviscida TaxID=2480587 RepID=A0A8H5F8G9_9AGAR|nr:hypothetical protein D9619_004696 [Psilocybe cf. subviscida]
MPEPLAFVLQPSPGAYDAAWSHLHQSMSANNAWKNTLLLPLAATVVSAATLLIQGVVQVCATSGAADEVNMVTNAEDTRGGGMETQSFQNFARLQGGLVIYAFKLARVFTCLALLVLALVSVEWSPPDIAIIITFCYTAALASLALIPGKWSRHLTRHTNAVLFAAFTVYMYRDFWPLATYGHGPIDIAEGSLLWAKLVVLTVAAVIIPLCIPRQYIPIEPTNPMRDLNPEQTASILSLMLYTFLDPIIFEANKVAHLPCDRLPPLADYDRAKHLKGASFKHLDPFCGAKKEHLFFSLMRVFSWEYFIMALAVVGNVIASFASPVAINRILSSIENSGEGDYVRPWVWVIALFFGPVFVSVCFQWYLYISTWALARTQGILTELVFEHSLRIRFKAGSSGDNTGRTPTASGAATPAECAPEVGDVDDHSTMEGGSDAQSVRTDSTAVKGKGKAKATTINVSVPAQSDAPDQAKKDNLIGKINTLVTADIDNITNGKDVLMLLVQSPLELVLAMTFLYVVLGWSSIVSFISIVLLLPAPGYIASIMQSVQGKKMAKTDARIQAVTETIGVIRMVKLFGWEAKMSETLQEKREEELSWMWKDKILNVLNDTINYAIPIITMLVTYATYTLIMKESLNASKVFSSIGVFDIIRNLLHRSSWMVSASIRAKVSLDRIGDFLQETELLDAYADELDKPAIADVLQNDAHDGVIGFHNATFTWSKEIDDGTQTPSSRLFKLRTEHLEFKQRVVNLIIGPTGCGKTSILMALLGEMHFIPSDMDSWYHLPRNGGVAYAAQESWVQNESVRDNILFGAPYDEERYQKVLHQCALKRDLELFEAGDQTEVGEKGLTLSGGQKARVTLARAIYSFAEIILLDDVLAALDVHTSKWIVEECLKGDLVRGRTVLLVTHNVALTAPIAENIITVGPDGLAHTIGTALEDILTVPSLVREVEMEQEEAKIEEEVIDEVKKEDEMGDGKLILTEEIQEGRVSWKSLKLFLNGVGGASPVLFFALWFSAHFVGQVTYMLAVWYLGVWGSQYEHTSPIEVRVLHYLAVYTVIQLASIVGYIASVVIYSYGTQRASRTINTRLIDSVLGSTLRWLDETPASRIIARCTQDMVAVDTSVAGAFLSVIDLGTSMLIKLVGPVIFTPLFLLPGIAIATIGIYIGNIYLKAQISVKREMSNARSPVLAHFGAAVAGMVSIRAYGAERSLKSESLKRIDHLMKISRNQYNLNRWISIRIDLLGAMFTSALAGYLITNKTLSAANIGFSLSMAVEFTAMILWLVRCYNDFEVQANSLERIQGYLEIEHEARNVEPGKPPAAWPTNGVLRVEGLAARYSQGGPKVLHNISFEVKSGERVGIVGRTGSGKSSLTLSLLRFIPTEGTVYLDGLPTDKINLDELRSNITIIPQMPELLSGTLRRNLDPFDQYDDSTLNNALRAAGLFSLQSEDDEARITLDSKIAGGGSNLSVGQRQIIALARAIVRNSKLLILDEATSAIDHKTDSIIQTSLRNELSADVTVLTIAHRLQTIMDADKIMVLDSGRIVEYDSPQVLLEKKGGQFKALVDESGDKKALYTMAANKGASTSG